MVSRTVQIVALVSLFLVQGAYTTTVEAAKSKCTSKTFRYTDKEGVTVTNSTLPPEYSQDGYEVICAANGLVLETVAPRKTDEQLRQEAIEAEKRAEEELLLREQQRLDAILINSYTDISDIERARDNELIAKDRDISLLNNNIRRITDLLEHAQTRAARDERLGIAISQKLLNEINAFKRRIAREKVNVEEIEADKLVIAERYDNSIIRFNELKAAERLRQFRESQDNSAEKNSIVPCSGESACENAWSASLRFASEYSTTDLAYANDSTIMMRKPSEDKDISLIITRVDNSNGDAANIVLEVRCAKTQKGEALCASEQVASIRDSFSSYLQAGPVRRP